MIGEQELSAIYQGKETLFANFPSQSVTGCFVFGPIVTNIAFLLLVQVKRFLAVANKTHLSITRYYYYFFLFVLPVAKDLSFHDRTLCCIYIQLAVTQSR